MSTHPRFTSVLLTVLVAAMSGSQVQAAAIDGGLPVKVTPPGPVFVDNPIADLTVSMNAADRALNLSRVFGETPSTGLTMDYVAVEIDPVTGQPAPGTGLFGYTFTLYGDPDVDHVFATDTLTFTGAIRQVRAFNGVISVDDELTADTFEGNAAASYAKALDTWLFDGWFRILPGNTNLGFSSGDTVTLSVGTGSTDLWRRKDLVYIVAEGDVRWDGVIAWTYGDYDVSGTARGERLELSVTGNSAPELVDTFIEHSDLRLWFAPDAMGVADITIRATAPNGAWIEDTFTITVVPEPATLILMVGGLPLVLKRKRKSRRASRSALGGFALVRRRRRGDHN
ncbi:MAG: PEP-CTERM sorting domain-containing protein [Phycisphaerae bacterium]|jgi:hypothetical protein|nr:PEP-CTERM sorting domain-containing protein [Phycisphaerae bacterium]